MLMGLVKFFLWSQVVAVCIVALLWTGATIRERRTRKNCDAFMKDLNDTINEKSEEL